MRALAVLPELAKRHEMLILAGGSAYEALHAEYPVTRIPTLTYALNRKGRRSAYRTIQRGLPAVMDLAANGPVSDMVADTIRDFAPEVVISDSEAWTHHAAARLGIPRISYDHFAVLAYCHWPMSWRQRLACRLEAAAYKKLMGRPERMVIVSFYDAPPRRHGVCVVGPVLRPLVRRASPSRGEHLLVYFSNGEKHFTPRVESALAELDMPVWVYGAGRDGRCGNIEFRPPSNTQFVADLASCRAVFATAGNQLISEAMHFGKPLLAMPEDSLEQQLNAAMVQRLGYGLRVRRDRISAATVRDLLSGEDRYSANLLAAARDGAAEAVKAIERFAEELACQR